MLIYAMAPFKAPKHEGLMTTKIYLKKVKAISPIIATIILIVITVVAGGFIYAYVSGMLHSGASTNVADVQSISLIPTTTGGTLALTVSNGGAAAITGVSYEFNGVTPATAFTLSPSTIQPGGSGSANTTVTISGGAVVDGTSYPLLLKVTFANGATQTISTSVTAEPY